MNKAVHTQPKLLSAILIIALASLQGCSESGSTDEGPALTELADQANTSSANDNENTNTTGGITNVVTPETELEQSEIPTTDSLLTDTNTDTSEGNGVDTPAVEDNNTDSNVGVNTDTQSDDINIDAPDPMVQNRTDVSFEVTVPAYQSNALQVQLSWGDVNTSLNWIGDELWFTEVNLPTDTENLLSIVFYDDDGNLALGNYEKTYRSGTNAAEIYQISADQFNTSRWDEDGDGSSNLDELIAGTDPDSDEDSLLEIRDSRTMGLLFIANYFETIIGNVRPMTRDDLNEIEPWLGEANTADIDASGNGTASASNWDFGERESRSATRTVLDNKVLWEGNWSFSNSDYRLWQEFNSEVTVDGDTRTLVETGTGSWIGVYSDRWETSVNVVGTPIEGSDFCKPTSATIIQTNRSNRDGGRVQTLTVTRELGDDLWRVMWVNETNTEINTDEYFARELVMHQIVTGDIRKVSEHDHFFCNFADL